MACFHPVQAWRGSVGKSGKRSVVFKAKDASPGMTLLPLKLPCGGCLGCRLERSRQWALRCFHEASLWDRNCFVTLTFDREHLPVDGSLSLELWQLFMKRLRKRFGSRIRFFMCGEYGEQCRECRLSRKECTCVVYSQWIGRPHYHACLFNFDFDDKYPWTIRSGHVFYRSPSLEETWGLGFSSISDVTLDSAAYVARYITKKVTGVLAEDWYCDVRTGVLLKPEFVCMSRGGRSEEGRKLGGIGRGWFDKFKDDLYPHDYAVVAGKKVRVPKFYDSLYELEDPEGFGILKQKRVSRSTILVPAWNDTLQKMQLIDDNCSSRLAVKEEVTTLRLKENRRTLEE